MHCDDSSHIHNHIRSDSISKNIYPVVQKTNPCYYIFKQLQQMWPSKFLSVYATKNQRLVFTELYWHNGIRYFAK